MTFTVPQEKQRYCLVTINRKWFIMSIVTYGNLMRIKTRHMKNERRTAVNPTQSNKMRFRRGSNGLFTWSRIIKPIPPRVNMKLDARPSIMYCPFTLYGIKATCNQKVNINF